MINRIKKVINAIKNYDNVVEELAHTIEVSENRQKCISKLQTLKDEKEDLLILKIKEIKKLEEKIIEKEERRRISAGKVGGLTKKITELNKELELIKTELNETKAKLEDSMTDKWLRVPLPPVKPPKQRMTTKPQKIKPATRKFMKSEFGK